MRRTGRWISLRIITLLRRIALRRIALLGRISLLRRITLLLRSITRTHHHNGWHHLNLRGSSNVLPVPLEFSCNLNLTAKRKNSADQTLANDIGANAELSSSLDSVLCTTGRIAAATVIWISIEFCRVLRDEAAETIISETADPAVTKATAQAIMPIIGS